MTECFHPREGQVALDDILRHHRFTRDLSDDHIATLALMASEVTLGEDELVLVDGQRSKSLYLLLDGSVSVELHTQRFTVSVQTLGAGQAFWLIVSSERPRHSVPGAGAGEDHRATPVRSGLQPSLPHRHHPWV